MFPASPQLGTHSAKNTLQVENANALIIGTSALAIEHISECGIGVPHEVEANPKKWIMMISPTAYHAPTPPNTLPSHCLKLPP